MRTHILVASLVVAVTARVASAEPVVLAVDGADIYVDLGAKDGVGAGTELALLHVVIAKDPRTGKTLEDSFSLGTLQVVKSGDKLSVAHADAALAKRVLAGDHVRLISVARTFVDPWTAQVQASKGGSATPTATPSPVPGGPGLDHVDLAAKAWQDTLGKAPEDRIERWSVLLAADPKSPYRKVIENEIQSLQAQIQDREAALSRAKSQRTDDRNPRIARLAAELAQNRGASPRTILAVAPLTRAVPGQPIQLAFLVQMPSAVGQAWLFVRPPGDPGFRRIDLVADGDSYLRATIDAAMVRAPKLEWYVEAKGRGSDGEVGPILGSQQEPMVTTIDDTVSEAPIALGRSHIDAHVDYVDFDGGLNKGFDQYYQAEIDFTYRFIEPVYAVRLGFGTLSGTGGPRDIIDADKTKQCLDASGTYQCRKVAFSYVYTEFEYRLLPNVAVMVRPQAGLLTTDSVPGTEENRCRNATELEGCGFHTRFGGRGRIRFGDEAGTNLVIGAGFTKGVGTLLEAAYHWLPHPVVPVQLTVEVTDMPVPEDFGVRLIGDVGWRKLSWFYPSLRLSYQARAIAHAGFSGGLAMNFDW